MRKISILALILSFFLLFSVSKSEDINLKDAILLKRPVDPVFLHLYYLQKEHYNPEKAAMALNSVNAFAKEGQEKAKKLIEILDAKGLYVEIDKIPTDPDYLDSNLLGHKYVLFESEPEIYLEKYGNKWQYSYNTVMQINELYSTVFPFKLSKIISKMPAFFQDKVFGLYLWQYIFFILYIILAFILYKIFIWIFGYIFRKIIYKSKFKKLFEKFVIPISKPISFIIICLFLISFIPMLEFPVKFNMVLLQIIKAFIPAFVTVIAYRLSDLVGDFLNKVTKKTKSTLDDQLVPFARKILKVIVITFGIIYILQSFGISIYPLLAGASIGGLAFALAAQDTVKNLFGSLTIFTDQPFQVGDWIVFDGMEGTVEEVGVRSTRIRTFYDSLISIPNGKLADLKIDNMGERKFRRYNTTIGLTYDSDPEKVEKFVEGLKEITSHHKDTRKDYFQIHVNNFGEKSIEILFYIFFEVPDWTKELEARHQVIINILKLAKQLDLRFAYPMRDYSKTVQS